MELKGKNVIYTGGFGGIGQACVKEFLESGVKNLAIFDQSVNNDVLQAWQTSYSASTIYFIEFDITKQESIEAAFKDAINKMQHFDVLVNGCAILNDKQVNLTVEINLLGVIHSTLTALLYMDKSKGGRGGVIMNIASVAGLEVFGFYAIYTASKHGVAAFTRALASPYYYERLGVSFITICPGLTATPLINDLYKKVTFDFNLDEVKVFDGAKRQSAEVCAKNMIKLVETGHNGGVYMIDLGKIKEITYPEFWQATF